MKRILITGGMGYIGRNLHNSLSFDYQVDICDYKEVHSGDLPLAQDLTAKDIQRYHGIVHLAALSGIKACEDDPKRAIDSNLKSAMNVFLQASRFKIPVVFTSSQAAKNPASSSYALQKRLIELMAEDLNNKGGNISVLRLTNVYGGRGYIEKKSTVIKQFITRYRENLVFEIDGDGSQTRDFIHVEDVCVFIELALNNPVLYPVDIGTGVGTSINDIADMFNRFFPLSKKTDPYPRKLLGDEGRSCGVTSNVANTSKAKELWKYEAFPRMREYINEQTVIN